MTEELSHNYQDLEENIYHIVKSNGKDILASYFISMKWNYPEFFDTREAIYIPNILKPYLEEFKDIGDIEDYITKAFYSYSDDLISQGLVSLDKDWERIIISNLERNLANIHSVFTDFFIEKLEYFYINEIFSLQVEMITEQLKNLQRAIPRDISKPRERKEPKEPRPKIRFEETKEEEKARKKKEKEGRKKRREEEKEERKKRREEEREKRPRKEPLKIIFYELDKQILLNKLDISSFKVIFPILNDFSIFKIEGKDVLYKDIPIYEKKYILKPLKEWEKKITLITDPREKEGEIRDKERLEKQIKSYLKNKEIIEGKVYPRSFISRRNLVKRRAEKHRNKIMKELYRINKEELMLYKRKRSYYGVIKK